MSQTGSPSFPPGLQAPETARRFPDSPARSVEILRLPPSRDDSRPPDRLSGEVIGPGQEKETLRIRTDRGEVEIRLHGRAPPPEAGRKVDLEIPSPSQPSSAPTRAILRLEPAPPTRPTSEAPLTQTRETAPLPPAAPVQTGETLPAMYYEASTEKFSKPAVRFVFVPPSRLSDILPMPTSSEIAATAILDPIPALSFSLEEAAVFVSPPSATALAGFSAPSAFPSIPLAESLYSRQIWQDAFSTVSTVRPSAEAGLPFEAAPLLTSSPTLSDFGPSLPSHALAQMGTAAPALSDGILFFPDPPDGPPVFSAFPSAPAFDAIPLFFRAGPPVLTAPETEQSSSPLPARPTVPSGLLSTAFAGQIGGVVLGQSPGGLPVISVDIPGSAWESVFVMHTPAPSLAAGTEVMLLPLAPAFTAIPPSSTPPFPVAATLPSSFEALWQALAQSAPALLAASAKLLPSPQSPSAFGPTALLFLAAARSGDLTGWIGDKAAETLRRIGKSDLAARAGRDLSTLVSTQENEGGWKSLPLPTVWDGQVHRALLHWRQDDSSQSSDNSPEKEGTRFVFDLDFERLGPAQLDGLMRRGRLDIALRTTAPLSAAMRESLRQRFAACMELSGLAGELHFQTDPDSWFRIKTAATPQSAWA